MSWCVPAAQIADLACLVCASTGVVLCARDAALPEAWGAC
jgi:hypothetical protein